ncbi:hypothetical protein BKP42_63050 [Rhodococcus erythropolis]|nr:hypothetical protein BKP42_63050 [Rhodococcus erythropolis]
MRLALRSGVLRQIEDFLDRLLRNNGLATTPLENFPQFGHTVGDTDNDGAIAVFVTPSAAINRAFARTTLRCVPTATGPTTRVGQVVV